MASVNEGQNNVILPDVLIADTLPGSAANNSILNPLSSSNRQNIGVSALITDSKDLPATATDKLSIAPTKSNDTLSDSSSNKSDDSLIVPDSLNSGLNGSNGRTTLSSSTDATVKDTLTGSSEDTALTTTKDDTLTTNDPLTDNKIAAENLSAIDPAESANKEPIAGTETVKNDTISEPKQTAVAGTAKSESLIAEKPVTSADVSKESQKENSTASGGDNDKKVVESTQSVAVETPKEISKTPVTPELVATNSFTSGKFVVDSTGKVGIDFLFDGGLYKGQLAIISLKGMEKFVPGSVEFIKEAAARAVSKSEKGNIAIDDLSEGARFTGNLAEGNYNEGNYLGVKTFAMTPGEEFGIAIVPNGTFQEVLNNPNVGGDKRLLFSMTTANPAEGFQVGQIADVTGSGKTFTMEDMRVDLGSDRDYNDFIFQVRGATGTAVSLDSVINPEKDWRKTDIGKNLIAYSQGETVTEKPETSNVKNEVTQATEKPVETVTEKPETSAVKFDVNYSSDKLPETLIEKTETPAVKTEVTEAADRPLETVTEKPEISTVKTEITEATDKPLETVTEKPETPDVKADTNLSADKPLETVTEKAETPTVKTDATQVADKPLATVTEKSETPTVKTDANSSADKPLAGVTEKSESAAVETDANSLADKPLETVTEKFETPTVKTDATQAAEKLLATISEKSEIPAVKTDTNSSGDKPLATVTDKSEIPAVKTDNNSSADKPLATVTEKSETPAVKTDNNSSADKPLVTVTEKSETPAVKTDVTQVVEKLLETVAVKTETPTVKTDTDRAADLPSNSIPQKSEITAVKTENTQADKVDRPSIAATEIPTNPELNISQDLPQNLTPGVWQVGKTGQINVNLLFDGGLYEGEVAIFNWSGMEKFEPNSEAFRQEAAKRALSSSELGHVVIRDRLEGAKFSGQLGEPDFNSGQHQGIKTFAMPPGDTFAVMMVPNGTVKDIAENRNVWADRVPLFSIPEANPDGKIQLKTDGQTLAWEDLPVSQSDRDFNDFMVKIDGAIYGNPANNLDEVTNWAASELRNKILSEALSEDRPPAIKSVADFALTPELPSRTIDLSQVFSDPEGKALTYEVIAGNSDALALNLSDNKLQLTSLQKAGITNVVIRATDAGGHSVVNQFSVTTSNLDNRAIASLNTNLAELNAAMNIVAENAANLNTDPTEKPLDTLIATFTENPDLLKLLAKPETFSALGINEQGTATLNKLLNDLDLAEELGLSGSVGEALSQPDETSLDKFLINAIDVEGLISSDAKQPRIGIIDFSQGQHIQQVTGAVSVVNPVAKYDSFTVKDGNWAAQLVRFVDRVRASGETGAIANLSLDLSQLDDIGITTRYELTPDEQTAIQYARENNVLLVVAAGNTGGVMSALGAASQQFDNIITVGAVDRLERKTDYSAVGEGLSIVAPGGEWNDDPDAFVGTSRATPYVTAAASLVWAANPELSYQQVKKLLLETAADLDVPGWDKNTGAGLLDVKEAVSRAPYIEPVVSDSPDAPFSISNFSGEGRVQTLERAASEQTAQAIKALENTQESLLEQWQNLVDSGNPALTLSELNEAAKQKIAEAVEKYEQASTEAAIATAQAQQWAAALALATQHYQIEQARLQALEAQKKELEEKLAQLGEQKTALGKETETLLANIQEQIGKAETDLAKAKEKLINPFGDADDSLQFTSEAVLQAAQRQQELAQQFQSQALGFDVERKRYAELAAGINTQRWQVVGSEKGRSGRRRETWGWGVDPQQQKLKDSYNWQSAISAQNSQSIAQLAQQAEQQSNLLTQYANFLEAQKNSLDLGDGSIEDGAKVAQILQEQAAEQQKVASQYFQQAAIAEQRRKANQDTADWHNPLINRWEQIGTRRTGRSGRNTEPVYGTRHYPEHIAPRDRAQDLANIAASEAAAYQQLAQQAQQQATSLQQQANQLQTRLKDWPVLKQGIEYEIAADALRLQAENDLLGLYTPVQRQKLETLDREIDLAQKALQKLNSEKLPAQQQATDLTENRLKETQAEVEAIEQLRKSAHQNFQNALEMSGFLLPYRERLSAVQQGIQQLQAAKLQVLETMQGLTKELLQTPSEIIQNQLKYWADYLENIEQELKWANLQKDQLAMAIADSPERLAISSLIKQLKGATAGGLPLQRYLDFLNNVEGSGANFLQGFDNLDKRLADAKTEKNLTEKELDKLEQEYRQLGLQKANLENNLIPDKEKDIAAKEQQIAGTESAIEQNKSSLSTILAAQLTDIPSAIASTDVAIQQQQSALQGYQNQIGQSFAAANSWEAERQRQQAAANYWNGQIYTRNGSGLLGFLSGLLYNTQAQANRNAAQAAANNAAYQRDLASSNAQQLSATLQPQIAATQQQIDTLETDKNLLVQLSQLNTQLSQQQQQRDTLVNELANLNQQKADTEQKLSNKYREIELTDEYLQQVDAEANRLKSRSDLLKQAGILEQKYQQNWQAWQQATQEQATATQNLLAIRESGEPLRQQLAALQQQLQGVEEQLKDGRSLQKSINELQQSLAFSNLQLGNQNLLLQSLTDRDPSLAAAEQAFLNQAAAHQQKIWYWNGSVYAYNPAEAEAYRANLQQASFIADQRNKAWQQRQQTTAKINELNQKIAQQQSDIAQKQSELSAIGPTVQQLEAQEAAVKGAIASVNQQLQPLQTEENRLAKVIQTAANKAQNLASELSQTTQLQSTALRQLIGFGILASESDVDFFATQVEPQVNKHLEQLRNVGKELVTQINNLKQQISNLEEKLANTADDVSKQALTNQIAQSQIQLSNLSSLEASNKTSADELEVLLKQATEALTPLRQKQELEIRQKLDSNDKRLAALQSQLNSEQVADAAIKSGTVLDYAQLADQINNDLRLNVTNGTQQLLASYPQTKELGQQQQDLSKSVDDLIEYIDKNYADPHGDYHRSEANLGDAIATLGVLENRSDALDASVSSTEDAIERIKLRIQQDADLWAEIAPIAIRYGIESEQLKQYQSELEAIKAAKSPQLGQAETLLTTAASLQQQAGTESNRYSMLTQQITALKNILPPQIRALLDRSTQIDRGETINLLGKTLTFNLSNSLTAILKTYPFANYAGIIDQINSLQQQAQAAQNQSSVLTQQASDLRKQADVLKQQVNDDVKEEVKALRSTFLKENPENGTAIDLLEGATLEGRSPDKEISNLLTATQADIALNADAIEGRNPNQALLDKAKAEQASHQAQGNAALAQAAWYEQQAAYHWSVSRKSGPFWYEKRWVKPKCGKGRWETITHIDHNWILWNQYSQIFPQLRQQGTANLVEADKWRQVVERIEPLAKQWTDANNAANEAEPAVKEARNLFAQLEAAQAEIPQAKTQQEFLETLLQTLREELAKAEAEAAAQNAKVQQEWTEYDTNSEEYRAAVADILSRRGELNKQAIATQQQLADTEKWVERQSVALGEELESTKVLIANLEGQKQEINNRIRELVKQGILTEDLDELNSNLAQVDRALQMLTNKAAILTSQQTALTQKRTMLTAQNEVIIAEQRLLDAYMTEPDRDYSNLQQQLNDARKALADAQRLAEQAEAASKILTAPLQQLKEDLLVQNDEHLKQARENQRILKALVEATQANANYTLQAAQKQQEVNNLELQILQRLQEATAAGNQEAKALLDVAKHNDLATVAEIYYRDYRDLASDRGGCAGGAGNANDRILADRYYREMLNHRELQRRARSQADAFAAVRKTAEAQMKTLQAQQETATKLLNHLNEKIAVTQEEREQKEQELAVAKARLDGITRIREQTEQTFVQLVSIEKLNLAQAELEKQIAKKRQAGIDAAVEARMERDALELERQRQETTAKIEQLKQLQAEDELRRSLNNVRGELGLETLEATEDPVELQTQLAGLIASLKELENQQPELPENVKALLAEARGDIHLALQGKEAAGIQENLLAAMDGLIGQIQHYKSEISRIDLEEQWDNQLLQTAQTDLQGASKQFLEELRRAEELSGEKQIINTLYQEALIGVAYAEQAVEISEDFAKQSKEILEQIIKQRIEQRKLRKKMFWMKLLGIISTVLGIMATIATIGGFAPLALGLGAASAGISAIQSAISGDWMGAIFSVVMAGVNVVTGGMSQALGESAKAVQIMKTLQTVASGAFNGARSLMSGDSIMGFLQILGSVASAASAGMGSFINQSSGTLKNVMLSVVQSLQQAPQMIYAGIKAIQNGDWLNAIGNFFNGVMAIGQSFAGNFNKAVAGILENISNVGNTALYLGNAIKDGGIEGWLSGLNGILGIWKDDLKGMVDKISDKEEFEDYLLYLDDETSENQDDNSLSTEPETKNNQSAKTLLDIMMNGDYGSGFLVATETQRGEFGRPIGPISVTDGGGGAGATLNGQEDNQQPEIILKGEITFGNSTSSNSYEYQIKAGDTLWDIAQATFGDGNRWHELQKADGSTFTEEEARHLHIGQMVYLPEGLSAASQAFGNSGHPATSSNSSSKSSLTSIPQNYGNSSLSSTNSSSLTPGQKNSQITSSPQIVDNGKVGKNTKQLLTPGQHLLDVGIGIKDGVVDTVKGTWELAKGTAKLGWDTITNPEEAKQTLNNLSNTGKEVVKNPLLLVNALTAPYKKAVESGHPGQAVGRGIFEVGSLLLGGAAGTASKGSKASKVGELAETVIKPVKAPKLPEYTKSLRQAGVDVADRLPLINEKFFKPGSRSADEINWFHTQVGRKPPYAQNTRVRDVVLADRDDLVRVHTKNNPIGGWAMRRKDINGLTPKDIKDKYALPEIPTHISDLHGIAGKRARIGIAGPIKGWGTGGNTQIEFLDRLTKSNFRNTRLLP